MTAVCLCEVFLETWCNLLLHVHVPTHWMLSVALVCSVSVAFGVYSELSPEPQRRPVQALKHIYHEIDRRSQTLPRMRPKRKSDSNVVNEVCNFNNLL